MSHLPESCGADHLVEGHEKPGEELACDGIPSSDTLEGVKGPPYGPLRNFSAPPYRALEHWYAPQ